MRLVRDIIKRMDTRVLVYLQQERTSSPVQAHFTQTVAQECNPCKAYSTMVHIKLDNSRLLVSNTDIFSTETDKYPSLLLKIPEETLNRGVDVGCATLLETSDGFVLLTRRAVHLKAFPGVWVPPGGHVEQNETLVQAALRELYEETGLYITEEQCETGAVTYLAMWESTFPGTLTRGLPRRHHLVLYLHAKLKHPYTAQYLQSDLRLEPNEVSASMWLSKDIAQRLVALPDTVESQSPVPAATINNETVDVPGLDDKLSKLTVSGAESSIGVDVAGSTEIREDSTTSDVKPPGVEGKVLPETALITNTMDDGDSKTIDVTVIEPSGQTHTEHVPLTTLLNSVPKDGEDVERISYGTKFALRRWLWLPATTTTTT